MIAEAENESRWPITESDRRQAVAAMMELVQSDDWPLAIRAARILIQMDAVNLVWDKSQNESIHKRIREMISERKRN